MEDNPLKNEYLVDSRNFERRKMSDMKRKSTFYLAVEDVNFEAFPTLNINTIFNSIDKNEVNDALDELLDHPV